jgi:hypothetical protein
MTRMLRSPAGLLLLAFMVLDIAIWIYTETAGSRLNAGTDITAQQLFWTALDALLVWRAWRGSRMAWGALLVINIIVLALLVLGGWGAYAMGLRAFIAVQTVLLLAPAVREHVRQGQQPAS